jgi:hypothetical protein
MVAGVRATASGASLVRLRLGTSDGRAFCKAVAEILDPGA